MKIVPRLSFGRLTDIPPDRIIEHMSDPRIAEHMPLLANRWNREALAEFVAAKEECWRRDGLGHWAILCDDEYVGWGGFQKEGDEWDFGLVLKPDHFGLGPRIVKKALEFARADARIPYVTFLLPPSRKHLRGLERLGVHFVGEVEHDGAWLETGLDVKVAVNLSVDNLNRLDLPEFIVEAAQNAGMNPHHVVLEVTESRLMEDVVKPLEILTRLRLKGLELSIDDFGTGHSSMEQLKRIPFTELKIDRAFVNGAGRDDTARSILESSVSLAKKLGMTIVAEGVEDQDDWDLVASLGVDLIQGYFVCRPLPGADLMDWLSDWTAANN